MVLAVAAITIAAGCGTRLERAEIQGAYTFVVEDGTAGSGAGSTSGAAAGGPLTATTVAGPASNASSGGGAGGGGPVGGAATGTGGGAGDATVSGGAIGTPGETGPIVIGTVGNHSGPAGIPQDPIAAAVQVWAAKVNANGGLFGREVQVIKIDDKGDPAQHLAALRDVVENRGAVAFVSNAASLTVGAGVDYLEEKGVPVIGTECSVPIEYESPVFFPQCMDSETAFYGWPRTAAVYGPGRRMALLSCAEAQACTNGYELLINRGLATEAGMDVVYTARVSLTQPDFTSECINARNAGAEVMFAILDPTGVARVAQSCARQGYQPTFVQASATVFRETKDKPGFSDLIVQTPVFAFDGIAPGVAEFAEAYRDYGSTLPGPAEAIGWAGAELFELAAFRAAELRQSISPATLIEGLHTIVDEDLGGLVTPLTFPPGGLPQPKPCWFASQVVDGEWRPINQGLRLCRGEI